MEAILSLVYWVILIVWLLLVWRFHLKDSVSLKIFLTLFIVGALLATFGARPIAEIMMRLGFIFLLVGITQALVEYKKFHGKKP